ncbi:MAG: DUF4845 domain-containing protein [Moraxellaceae bacterium]
MQRHAQRGMSYIGVMFVAMLFAFAIKVVAAVGSDYYDNYTIGKIVRSLLDEGRTGSVEEFRRALSDRFQINNIRDKSPDDFEYRMEGKTLVVVVDYEVRKNFVANLDVVMHFNKTYSSELTSAE